MRHPLPQTEGRGGRIEARLAIIGIGQSLRGDDAAGLEAVESWRRDQAATAGRSDIRVESMELPGLALLEMLDGVEGAIIIDAVQGGAPPGTIHHVAAGQLESFASSAKSAHGWGVAETLRLRLSLDPKLKGTEVCVIGIEAEQYTVGGGLSRAVKEALPRASAAIQLQVERLLKA
jgi:hydrogenase maturation protease